MIETNENIEMKRKSQQRKSQLRNKIYFSGKLRTKKFNN